MSDRARRSRAITFVTWAMRLGYATRAVIYGVMGGIALFVGLLGGEAAGLLGSIRWIGHLPGQAVYLIVLAVGMIAYTIWRGGDAVVNLAGHNPHATGWVVRGGHFFIGALYIAFTWYALRVAFAQNGGGGIGGIFQSVMGNSIGRWFVVVVGFGTLSFGLFSIYKGISRRFRLHMREFEHARRPVSGLRLRADRARDRDRRHGRPDHLVGLDLRAAAGRRLRPDAEAHPRGLVRPHDAGDRRHRPARLRGLSAW